MSGQEYLDNIAHVLSPASQSRVSGYQARKEWPEALDEVAFHGIAGDVVRVIEPHTESDPAAILIQFLAAVGNCIGRGPHYLVEGDQHGPQLFVVLVGETARGRKGTSWSRIRQIMEMVGDEWAKDRIVSGLSSAEGLLHAVRDATDGDPGASDRRLLVYEPEFASALRVMMREGNILSAVTRQAWDRGDLRTLTKHSPITATGTHISIIGHITADELRRYMDRTETANGYANRFLYTCVRRARCLPDGGGDVNLHGIAKRLAVILTAARKAGRVRMDDDARAAWHSVYPALSDGLPGMLGAITARAEAQVIRLSLIYSLLDGTDIIGPHHLKAALAVWSHAEASARYVWGSEVGDPIADDLVRALRAAGDSGMTRTEIRDLFRRNRSGEQIGRALGLLRTQGRITARREETEGRPVERWFIAR